MISIERLVSILNIIKTPEEILQMIELFLDDISIDSYETLKIVLKCIDQKLRVFVLDIFKTNNKLPPINAIELPEQLLDLESSSLNSLSQPSSDNLYVEIFKKLLDDKILICSNVVELTIFVDRCPDLLFELLHSVKGDSEIDDTHKRFIIAEQGLCFIKKQIEKHGEQHVARTLSKIFWNVEWYEKCCKGLKIAENIYKPFVAEIKKDNLNIETLSANSNLHDYPIGEKRISKTLIDNVVYNVTWTRDGDSNIKISITKQTVHNCEKIQIFSRTLTITRGLKLTLEDVLDKTPGRTYHLK